MRDKLVIGEKTQTVRCLYVPTFEENEIIMLKFKKEPLFEAKITDIYAKKIKDLTLEEAKRDGFKSVKTFIKAIKELNHLESTNRWCFVIRFKRISEFIDKFVKGDNDQQRQ